MPAACWKSLLPKLAQTGFSDDSMNNWMRYDGMTTWLKVDTGQGIRWVDEDECRLRDGRLAFITHIVPVRPVPDWFVPPENAVIRLWNNPPGLSPYSNLQVCSAITTPEDVLEYYAKVVQRAGLVLDSEQPRVGRATPGFQARSDEIRFSIDAIQYRNVVYWTIQIGAMAEVPIVIRSGALKLVEQDGERLTLQVIETGEQCWAPATALADVEPVQIKNELPRAEPITWSTLPEWLQFGIPADSKGVLRTHAPPSLDEWEASIDVPLKIDWREALASCLADLDSHGFDATAIQRPNRNYYLIALQWGHSIGAHIVNDGETASVTFLNTLGYMSLHVRYEHPRSARLPQS
jgi:hypothetical protein